MLISLHPVHNPEYTLRFHYYAVQWLVMIFVVIPRGAGVQGAARPCSLVPQPPLRAFSFFLSAIMSTEEYTAVYFDSFFFLFLTISLLEPPSGLFCYCSIFAKCDLLVPPPLSLNVIAILSPLTTSNWVNVVMSMTIVFMWFLWLVSPLFHPPPFFLSLFFSLLLPLSYTSLDPIAFARGCWLMRLWTGLSHSTPT